MKKTTIIRIVNIVAIIMHIARFVLAGVAIFCFFGEAEGSLWPTQFVAFGCAIAAVMMIYLTGKVISWLDKVSDRIIHG